MENDRFVILPSAFHLSIISQELGLHLGINEDPVTGSAYCHLAPYWAEKLGKIKFTAYQASRRGGILRVRLAGERTKLARHVVTMMAGGL